MLTFIFSLLHLCMFRCFIIIIIIIIIIIRESLCILKLLSLYKRNRLLYYLIVTSVYKSRFLFIRRSNFGAQRDTLMMVRLTYRNMQECSKEKKVLTLNIVHLLVNKRRICKNARCRQSQEFKDTISRISRHTISRISGHTTSEFHDSQSLGFQDKKSQNFMTHNLKNFRTYNLKIS